MQSGAGDDAQQVITIDLARGTQTTTLTGKEDTDSPVNSDRVKVLSNETEILTLVKTEGVVESSVGVTQVTDGCKIIFCFEFER